VFIFCQKDANCMQQESSLNDVERSVSEVQADAYSMPMWLQIKK